MTDTISEAIDDVITTTSQADLSLDILHSIDANIEKSFDTIIDHIYEHVPEVVDALLTEDASCSRNDLLQDKKQMIKQQRNQHTSNVKHALHSLISEYRQSFMNYKSKILNQLYDTRKSVAEHRKSYEVCARQRENERIRVLVTKLTTDHEEIVAKLSADLEEYTTGYHVVRDRNAEYIMENARLSEIIIGLEEKNTQLEVALAKAQNQIKELEVKKSRPTGKRLTMKKPSRSVLTKSHSLDAYAQKLTSGNSTPDSSRRSTGSRRPISRDRRESRAGISTPESRDRRESKASLQSESRDGRPSSRSSERAEVSKEAKDSKPPPTSVEKIEIVNMASLQGTSIDTMSTSTLTMLPHDISGIVEGANEDQSIKVSTPPSEAVIETITRNHTETSAGSSNYIEHTISEESIVTTPSIDRSVNSEDRETETMSRDYGSQDYEDGSVYGESEYGESESLLTDRQRLNTEAIQKLREYENVIRIQKQEMERSEQEISALKVQVSEMMELYTAQELEVKQLKDEIIMLKEMPQSSRSVGSKSYREPGTSLPSEIDDSRPVTSSNEQVDAVEEVRFFNIHSSQSLQSFASKDSLVRREQHTANERIPDSARQSVTSDEVFENRDAFAEDQSVSVPNSSRSHRLSTPLQPVATRFMGGELDVQPAKVEVDVYNMLTEAVNVQRRLESELLQNHKERTELQSKVSTLESYITNQEFLHKLKLRERGILLKELSDQVNELRRHVVRDKKIIAEKNRLLPTLSKPLRERSPVDQRKQEMHLFKLELSLDDADISPAVRSSFPTVASGFPADNQTSVTRPKSSGYPKNISQSLKELVGSTADHKKPSLFSSSGGQFGKVKTTRPATTAAAARSTSPPQFQDAQLLAGLTDIERQEKVKQDIASIRKQIAELVLVQETELRRIHKQKKAYPIRP